MAACPNCATPLPADSKFCPRCGASTPTEISGERAATTVRAPILSGAEAASARRAELQRALGAGFEVKDLIGQGGFGEVWAAFDVRLKREVAVKVLLGDLAVSPGLQARFAREAEAAAKLRHPNIIPIYQVGEAEGLTYIIMPLVRGESLRALLQREPALPIPEVRRLLHESALALEVAHRAGIVHRDVKPENILLDGDERRVLLMDFGIARAIEAEGSRLTGTGLVIGTPQYMSPEQATAEKNVDHRADIYSLGVVAYELLTGRPLFESDSTRDLIVHHLTSEPPNPRRVRAEIPEELADAVLECLGKKPDDRWQSAAAVAAAFAPPVLVSVESPLQWLGRKFRVGTRSTRRRLRFYAAAFVTVMATLALFSRGSFTRAWYYWTWQLRARHAPAPVQVEDSAFGFRIFDEGVVNALASVGENQLIVASRGGGPVKFDGRTWEALAIPDPVLPPVRTASGLWIYSREGASTIGYHLVGRELVPADTLRGRVTTTWSGSGYALLGLADGGMLRGRPRSWLREPTGTRSELTGIWGDDQRQVAVGYFARRGATDSLLVFNGFNWRPEDPRPVTGRDAQRWVLNTGVVLEDGAIVVAGQVLYEQPNRPRRALLVELPRGGGRWQAFGPSLPDEVELWVLLGEGRSGLWAAGRGNGCHSQACLFRITRDSVERVAAFGADPVLGLARLNGELVAVTVAGLLWAYRGGQWGLLSEVLGSAYLGRDPAFSGPWSAATVVVPGVVGVHRVVGGGVASGNTSWDGFRPVSSYRFRCRSALRVAIAVTSDWDNTVSVFDASLDRLGFNDDAGGTLNALLRWTCPDGAEYWIGVSPFARRIPLSSFVLSVTVDSLPADRAPQTPRESPVQSALPPSAGMISLGDTVTGRFDPGAKIRTVMLSTGGELYERDCVSPTECAAPVRVDIPDPVLDVTNSGGLVFAATARQVFARRQTWEVVDVTAVTEPFVALAGSEDSMLAGLTARAVWVWRAHDRRWMRWRAVPSTLGRPARIVIAAGGRAAVVMGEESTVLLRDSFDIVVLGRRQASDAVFLRDGRIVLALPSDDPLVSGSVLVTTWAGDHQRELPAPGGRNVFGLSLTETSIWVGASGWSYLMAAIRRLPFTPDTSSRGAGPRPLGR